MDTELDTIQGWTTTAFKQPYCEFVGWQRRDLNSHIPFFRLFWPGHPLNNSLVDANTALRLEIPIPETDRCIL